MAKGKAKELKLIIQQLHRGVPVEIVKEQFEKSFGKTSAEELAMAERQLIEEGLPVSEIQRLCDVHAAVFEGSIEEIHQSQELDQIPGHPAFVFRKENAGLEMFLDESFDDARNSYAKNANPENREKLHDAIRKLSKLDRHYKRKENLLFPYLEAAGMTAPPKVMWAVDDEIRELWKKALSLLEGDEKDFKKVLKVTDELGKKVRSMISKEEKILMPLLLDKLSPKAWFTVAGESAEIGYCFNGGIEGGSPSDAAEWYENKKKNAKTSDENPKPEADYSVKVPAEDKEDITLPSGHLSKKELLHMLNTLPADITFVGADDNVKYFSEGKNRVFPRTRTIIGRDVANCHPPKSLKVVEKLVQDFRDGVKDEEAFWLQRGGKFVLIRYYAVRDSESNYLGVLEVTEEISKLRELSDEKTLASND